MLPSLPRQLTKPQILEDDQEIWQPDWHCYCCHDSGLIPASIARRVISDYDTHSDLTPVCQRCSAAADKIGSPNFDQRFNRSICNELDSLERHDWLQTTRLKQGRIVDFSQLTGTLAMPGSRGRTANDEREIQIRKQEIEARAGAEL